MAMLNNQSVCGPDMGLLFIHNRVLTCSNQQLRLPTLSPRTGSGRISLMGSAYSSKGKGQKARAWQNITGQKSQQTTLRDVQNIGRLSRKNQKKQGRESWTASLVKFTWTTVGKSTFATSRTWKHGGRNLIPSGSGTPFMRAKLCQNVDRFPYCKLT